MGFSLRRSAPSPLAVGRRCLGRERAALGDRRAGPHPGRQHARAGRNRGRSEHAHRRSAGLSANANRSSRPPDGWRAAGGATVHATLLASCCLAGRFRHARLVHRNFRAAATARRLDRRHHHPRAGRDSVGGRRCRRRSAILRARTGRIGVSDGTPAQVFWHVTVPRSTQAIGAAFLWVAVATAGEITIADLFGIRSYAEQVYTEFCARRFAGAAPWRILPGMIAAGWVIAAGLLLVSRLVPPDRHTVQRASHQFCLGRSRTPLTTLTLSIVALLAGVPIGSLALKAGMIVTRHGRDLARTGPPPRAGRSSLAAPRASRRADLVGRGRHQRGQFGARHRSIRRLELAAARLARWQPVC